LSLTLHLHQVGQRTFTSKLLNMPSTQLNRSRGSASRVVGSAVTGRAGRRKRDFTAWTKSEQFRAAHQHAGERKPLTLGHPEFEGFEVIQTIETTHPSA